MKSTQIFICKKVSCFILILLFVQPVQAKLADSWWWIFVKENFISENRHYTRQLFSAVKAGDRSEALTALNKGANINARDKKGRTPLHWAIYNTDFPMAEFLIQKGADVNAVNHRRRTPLHWAVLKPPEDFTLLLLEKGADPNKQDKRGWTPLHWLALKPDEGYRDYLRKKTSKDIQNEQDLHLYNWNEKDLKKIRLLLAFNADPNLLGEDYDSPLQRATFHDRLEVVQLLVQKGAKVNVTNLWMETPLHLIAKRKKLKKHSLAIALFLLEKGADPNILNLYAKNPMKLSVENNTYELQEILRQFGGVVPPQNFCMKLFQRWNKTSE